ncbi:DUF1569 domain-containing protein [Mucilaginibacter sp. OK283]|jgi:hypothetical protein|uniref:DUF1569 domain-containing protein n=1 Tax=Mucilaginibacter sp. OK283 TaxID=1881049 RepID=UPI0008CB58A9|nr:DUF1569 domain-containing protein [Mucilaginibacter sp. OK283]SEO93143.1 Protein of unknown function [Mucilaginibacter sp. OK283]
MKRRLINKELWYSFIAILKYFTKALIRPQVDGLLFYEPEKQAEFRRRVQSLTPGSKRVWGTMVAAQMLHHLNLSLGGALGDFDLWDESYGLSRTVFKWLLVDFFPEQPRGLRMPLNFIIPREAQYDFEQEQKLLLEILDKAWATPTESWGPHPLFGRLTRKQWGKLALIHIDYHLRQFSA